MAQYKSITVEAGQSLNRIALQEYGNSNIETLNMIVADNTDVLQYGITSVPAAGTTLLIRKDYNKADTRILNQLAGININQHILSQDDPLTPDDDEINITIPENTPITIVIGSILTKSVLIYCYWKENTQIFSGLINAMHDNATAKFSWQYDSFYGDDTLLQIETQLDETLNMILTLPNTSAVFTYKIIAQL